MNRVGLLHSSLGRVGVWAFLLSLSFLIILGSSLGNSLGNIAWGQSVYTLGFAGQTTYNSDPAGTVKSDQPFDATLTQTGGTVGEQGWSISMTMENGLITDITTKGSILDTLSDPQAPGF